MSTCGLSQNRRQVAPFLSPRSSTTSTPRRTWSPIIATSARAQNLEPVPIVFTFSVCGSMKTLEFLQWLGVDVPRWIANELRHADDTLDASYAQAVATAIELIAFCRRVGVPFGLNVESVSICRVEIEASVRLAARLRAELRR
jgi:hypothetical protein